MGENEREAKHNATRRAAKDTTDAELDAARMKTARLKGERLAREAAELDEPVAEQRTVGPRKRAPKRT